MSFTIRQSIYAPKTERTLPEGERPSESSQSSTYIKVAAAATFLWDATVQKKIEMVFLNPKYLRDPFTTTFLFFSEAAELSAYDTLSRWALANTALHRLEHPTDALFQTFGKVVDGHPQLAEELVRIYVKGYSAGVTQTVLKELGIFNPALEKAQAINVMVDVREGMHVEMNLLLERLAITGDNIHHNAVAWTKKFEETIQAAAHIS